MPLPQDLYERLRVVADADGLPCTALAREAIEQWLRQRRCDEVGESIASYAEAHAGTVFDLDEKLEEAGLEILTEPDNDT